MDSTVTASSLDALTQAYQDITHNLANVSTVGFKRWLNEFRLVEDDEGDTTLTSEIEVMSMLDFSQGHLVNTGRPLDLALSGSGFFVIETPEGRLYTRNGQFRFNTDRQLVDFAGRTVAGTGGPIVLPATTGLGDFHVSPDGSVSAKGQSIGKLQIVEFESPSDLIPDGNSNFVPEAGVEPTVATQATVRQGFTEAANVNIVEELVDLIRVTRLYEANIQTLQTLDERMEYILNVALS